ncbi:uncharacterized protein SPAPADRAFT_137182 [Spathaspora passalidarum NRRL Y-27907]|uniref:DNA repair protein rhp7 treble clef domain-containing protein n=1 Tax=Spathaspora passalidarum (strain NRRL Y-27907 / 11-Y1) TaxID=619300 RepID=G3ALK7_SPAPN|nr:uncharacterized protein SPAPADRAFT_137182 [Spathaspora passalidarum NRRL Y-27907]EGW33250.1 hypothetical protein SPAPADRAFT_137182 [Spathaspora passalidarum NRRL Y-27907]
MSNRERRGVRGPNSALTEFLRNEGITDAFRRRRELQQDDDEVEAEPEAEQVQQEESEDDEEVREMKRAAALKRGRDSDSEDEDEHVPFKKFGEIDHCVDCGSEFHLSVYSRFINSKSGYLCENCNSQLLQRERQARINQLQARKQRKRIAQALLNRTTVSKIPKLQDVCIREIIQHINEVEVLGDIGNLNRAKISQILSKNRQLTSKTVDLFLTPDLTSLELWDCSNIDSAGLDRIASYCPNLQKLTLFMCGQLHNDNLKYYAEKLKKLTSLKLNGPFLISESAWSEFFDIMAPQLEEFEVRNTHRFSSDSLISLITQAPKLSSLKLSRLDGITTSEAYGLIPHCVSDLAEFEVSYTPHMNDESISNLLAITGPTLVSLNLDGCTSLTDTFLPSLQNCTNLTTLSLRQVPITDTEFAKTLKQWNGTSLQNVDLYKCIDLGDAAIYALLNHSHSTLIELNLNSIPLTRDLLTQVLTEDDHPIKKHLRTEEKQWYKKVNLPLLTYLDLGFVRSVDDEVVAMVGDECKSLHILEVYGDNRCTIRGKVRSGLIVIGRLS